MKGKKGTGEKGGGETGGGGGRHLAQRRGRGRGGAKRTRHSDGPPAARPQPTTGRASYVVCVLATSCRDYTVVDRKMHLQNHQKSPSFDLPHVYAVVTMGGSFCLDRST